MPRQSNVCMAVVNCSPLVCAFKTSLLGHTWQLREMHNLVLAVKHWIQNVLSLVKIHPLHPCFVPTPLTAVPKYSINARKKKSGCGSQMVILLRCCSPFNPDAGVLFIQQRLSALFPLPSSCPSHIHPGQYHIFTPLPLFANRDFLVKETQLC